MRVAFTGHRWYEGQEPDYLRDNLAQKLLALKPELCFSGMALGFDMLAAEVCLDLNIAVRGCIPFEGQHQRWPDRAQDRYRNILRGMAKQGQCGSYVVGLTYDPSKFQARNEYMVDHADLVLAYYTGKPGGTRNCLNYARTQGKRIINLAEVAS